MKWMKIIVFSIITIAVYANCKSYTQHGKWEKISNQRIYSVSGLVHHKNGFLIVHDNKKENQQFVCCHINVVRWAGCQKIGQKAANETKLCLPRLKDSSVLVRFLAYSHFIISSSIHHQGSIDFDTANIAFICY